MITIALLLAFAGCRPEPHEQPPTDAGNTYVARAPSKIPITVNLNGGGSFSVEWDSAHFNIESKASLPNKGWSPTSSSGPSSRLTEGESKEVDLTNTAYGFRRKVTVYSDHVGVQDTFHNNGASDVGVIIENRAHTNDAPSTVRLAGLVRKGLRMRSATNPSVYGGWNGYGLALVAEDDAFRNQNLIGSDPPALLLADDQLVVKGGSSVTLEWSLYPTQDSDYWSFVNAARRNWGTNRLIDGPFAFAFGFQTGMDKTKQDGAWFTKWIKDRDLKIVVGDMPKNKNGTYAHGSAAELATDWIQGEKHWQSAVAASLPDVKRLGYFHIQLSTEDGGASKYADSKLIDDKQQQMKYPGKDDLPLYVPSLTNSYGKTLWNYLKVQADEIGVSGLYWDEMSGSFGTYNYAGEWDGVNGQIDPTTHEIINLRSQVALQIQPMEMKIIDWAKGKGLMIIGNGMPKTRTIMQQPIMRFQETQGTFDQMANTHLQWPVGLANNNIENTDAEAVANAHGILEAGGVYCGFRYLRPAAAWNFTSVMYPITPVELHEGVVLGKERIHTSRSGTYGWADGAKADLYVVNADGTRNMTPSVQEVKVSGKLAYKLTLDAGQIAIFVKQ